MLKSQVKPLPYFGYRPGSKGMETYENIVTQYNNLIARYRIYPSETLQVITFL